MCEDLKMGNDGVELIVWKFVESVVIYGDIVSSEDIVFYGNGFCGFVVVICDYVSYDIGFLILMNGFNNFWV